ncbi:MULTISPECIES: hypothetical protein [Anaeromyxobacter]|uniref:hypothetical protein n=1 Tax=Anaeromyxobacter TaxID=161492 RepID=UPI001F58CF56|nr:MULTISPECIES: hypothetical protein [unclassified Anaeromyxobacter]
MRPPCRWAGVAAMMLAAPLARAHELVCEKTVNGAAVVEVDSYPATLTFQATVRNVHPTDVSIVAWISDRFMDPARQELDLALPVGGSQTFEYGLTIDSYEECVALAGEAGMSCSTTGGCARLDNRFAAGWEHGEAQCTARVVCKPPEVPPPPPPSGVTRTLGFWKTHVDAATACIAGGPIDLGFTTIDTLEELLGLLWASPARYVSGEPRDALARFRILLAHQTAAAICNGRAFGTSSPLVADAVTALGGTACGDIKGLIDDLAAFNTQGDALPFPDGFAVGPAQPVDARALGVDPTSPTGETCSP